MKDRLMNLISNDIGWVDEQPASEFVDYLLAEGVIALPGDTVYRIVDKGTSFATVMPKSVDELTLFELKNLSKYGYYTSQEEAEKHLK